MIDNPKTEIKVLGIGTPYISYALDVVGTCYGEHYEERIAIYNDRRIAERCMASFNDGLRFAYQQMRIQLQDKERQL